MSKGITVSTLEHVSPSAVSAIGADAGKARKHFHSAFDTFVDHVAKPIGSPAVWHGGGQPDAAVVMRINRMALGISELQMESTQKTLTAFGKAMATAKRKILSILEDAKEKLVIVHENGDAEVDLHAMPGPSASADAKRIAREAKGTLVYAALADYYCTSLLNRINGHTPQYSNTADPKVLAANEQTVDFAIRDYDLARASLYLWERAQPRALPDPGTPLAQLGNLADYLWDHPGDLSRLAVDGIAIDVGVAMVVGGSAGDLGAVTISFTGIGLLVAVPAAAVDTAVIIVGAGVAAGGAGAMGGDLARMNKNAQSQGRGNHNTQLIPRKPARVAPKADDPQLQNRLNDLHHGSTRTDRTGNGTTTDAIRAERITGNGAQVQGKSHVRKGWQYVRSLTNWIRNHPNASASDKALAQQELTDLLEALRT